MMNWKFRLAIIFMFFSIANGSAQTYNWLKGGGSTSAMTYSRDWERVTAMCTDDDKNVYVVSPVGDVAINTDTFLMPRSFICCSSLPHTLVASYDCRGNLRWAKLIDAYYGTASNGIIYSMGSIYMTGAMRGGYNHIGYDTTFNKPNLCSYILRIDTGGRFKWVRFTGKDTVGNEWKTGIMTAINGPYNNIAADGQGNLHHYDFVNAGARLDSTTFSVKGTYDLKYDTIGNLLSVTQLEMDTNSNMTRPIINKRSGAMYATVYVTESWGGRSTSLAGYDRTGHIIWYDTCYWPNGYNSLSYDEGSGKIFAIGATQVDSTGVSKFPIIGDTLVGSGYARSNLHTILTLDTFGRMKRHFDVNFETYGVLYDIAAVPEGKVAVAGILVYAAKYGPDSMVNTTHQQEPMMAVFDTLGHLLRWDNDSSNEFYNYGTSIAADNIGDIYLGGMVSSNLTISGLPTYSSSGGNTDFFVAKYGYTCGCTIAPTPSFSYSGVGTVAFTYTGTPVIDSIRWDFGDTSTSTATSPTHTYTYPGIHRVCLTIYTSCGPATYCQYINMESLGNEIATSNDLIVYPNPSKGSFTIEYTGSRYILKMYNLLGQMVFTDVINNRKQSICTTQLVSGSYILQLTDLQGNRIVKTIVLE